MIAYSLCWLFHWFGQGLKLGMFSTLAYLCVVPLYLPLTLLERPLNEFDQLSFIGKFGTVAGCAVCVASGIAVFTAVLASQLKNHPLKSPPPAKQPNERTTREKHNQAEQNAARRPVPRV